MDSFAWLREEPEVSAWVTREVLHSDNSGGGVSTRIATEGGVVHCSSPSRRPAPPQTNVAENKAPFYACCIEAAITLL